MTSPVVRAREAEPDARERTASSSGSGPASEARPDRFGPHVLELDCAAESKRIEDAIVRQVRSLNRRGVVLGVSGGIDSAVCAALAARALGPDRVRGLLMPGRSTAPESTARGRAVCDAFRIPCVVEDLTPVLDALGCQRRRDAAVRRLFPDHAPGGRFKIALSGDLLAPERLNVFTLVVEDERGAQRSRRMPPDVYLEIVAATNMKQRVRALVAHHQAECLNYAVLGTPNRLEYDQGFFVRGGDGLADLKPIAHLYKTQVYAMAAHLGVPADVVEQPPTTDTYSLPQSQEEFYFALPHERMDLMLYAYENAVSEAEVGRALGLTARQVASVYRDIEAKRRVAARLHQAALLVEDPAAEDRR